MFLLIDNNFDVLIMDSLLPEKREYNIPSGKGAWKKQLMEQFPYEKQAIDRFFDLVQQASYDTQSFAMVKILPLWIVKLANLLGITYWLSSYFSLGRQTVKQVVEVNFEYIASITKRNRKFHSNILFSFLLFFLYYYYIVMIYVI